MEHKKNAEHKKRAYKERNDMKRTGKHWEMGEGKIIEP